MGPPRVDRAARRSGHRAHPRRPPLGGHAPGRRRGGGDRAGHDRDGGRLRHRGTAPSAGPARPRPPGGVAGAPGPRRPCRTGDRARPLRDAGGFQAAGAVRATPHDLLTFLEAHLDPARCPPLSVRCTPYAPPCSAADPGIRHVHTVAWFRHPTDGGALYFHAGATPASRPFSVSGPTPAPPWPPSAPAASAATTRSWPRPTPCWRRSSAASHGTDAAPEAASERAAADAASVHRVTAAARAPASRRAPTRPAPGGSAGTGTSPRRE